MFTLWLNPQNNKNTSHMQQCEAACSLPLLPKLESPTGKAHYAHNNDNNPKGEGETTTLLCRFSTFFEPQSQCNPQYWGPTINPALINLFPVVAAYHNIFQIAYLRIHDGKIGMMFNISILMKFLVFPGISPWMGKRERKLNAWFSPSSGSIVSLFAASGTLLAMVVEFRALCGCLRLSLFAASGTMQALVVFAASGTMSALVVASGTKLALVVFTASGTMPEMMVEVRNFCWQRGRGKGPWCHLLAPRPLPEPQQRPHPLPQPGCCQQPWRCLNWSRHYPHHNQSGYAWVSKNPLPEISTRMPESGENARPPPIHPGKCPTFRNCFPAGHVKYNPFGSSMADVKPRSTCYLDNRGTLSNRQRSKAELCSCIFLI